MTPVTRYPLLPVPVPDTRICFIQPPLGCDVRRSDTTMTYMCMTAIEAPISYVITRVFSYIIVHHGNGDPSRPDGMVICVSSTVYCILVLNFRQHVIIVSHDFHTLAYGLHDKTLECCGGDTTMMMRVMTSLNYWRWKKHMTMRTTRRILSCRQSRWSGQALGEVFCQQMLLQKPMKEQASLHSG
jgi:hypothetical protein